MKYFILRMHVLLIALTAVTGIQAQDVTTEVDGIICSTTKQKPL